MRPQRLYIVERFKCFFSAALSALRYSRGNLSQIFNDTVLVEENVLDGGSCRALMESIDSQLEMNGEQFVDDAGADRRIFYFERQVPNLIVKLQIEDLLIDISKYLGANVKHWFLMANKVEYRPGNKGSGGGFHRDSVYSHQLKVIWYLNDVGNENGPFAFVRGSHKRLFSRASPLKPPHSRCEGTPEHLEAVTGDAGLRLVCDTRCVHGGMPVLKGCRYAVTLYTFTSEKSYRLMQKKIGF